MHPNLTDQTEWKAQYLNTFSYSLEIFGCIQFLMFDKFILMITEHAKTVT
uniref:Uncharacterized protein n=1 Tax=Anguilla anguilla TaxID=7936 RepID=A0A0E9W404_ANGAN